MARTRTDAPPQDRPRRGKGEGSIYQRKDGRWVAELQLGYDAEGKRRKKLLYGQTRKDVIDKIKGAQLEMHKNDGILMEPSKLTVAEYLAQWLEQIRPTRRQSSYRIYDTAVRLHIVPEIGAVPLAKLNTLHIQRLYTSKTNEGYAANTIRNLHTALNIALEQAVKWQLIPRNVSKGAELPRVQREEMRYLTPEQVQQFIRSLRGSTNKFWALFATAVLTGLRLGELTGLTWADADLQGGQIRVNRNLTWDRSGKVFQLGEPKTKFSRRAVPIPATLTAILKTHRKEQAEAQLRAKVWHDSHGLVFTFEDGRPLHQSHIRRLLGKALAEAGLPEIRFHDLRHTYATLLMTQGTHVKVASSLLGHSSVKITLDLYSHVVPGLETTAADQLDALLTGQVPKANTPRA